MATTPMSFARSTQALSRSRLRTVSYLLRSIFLARSAAGCAAARVAGESSPLVPASCPLLGALPPPPAGEDWGGGPPNRSRLPPPGVPSRVEDARERASGAPASPDERAFTPV